MWVLWAGLSGRAGNKAWCCHSLQVQVQGEGPQATEKQTRPISDLLKFSIFFDQDWAGFVVKNIFDHRLEIVLSFQSIPVWN